mmetsp:Transcript_30945/g.80974  ORF Transcript_30945/g.80974 Transcript_30945/m.80974 type:complete len:977 (+) Transcript_30945:71-3001(+)
MSAANSDNGSPPVAAPVVPEMEALPQGLPGPDGVAVAAADPTTPAQSDDTAASAANGGGEENPGKLRGRRQAVLAAQLNGAGVAENVDVDADDDDPEEMAYRARGGPKGAESKYVCYHHELGSGAFKTVYKGMDVEEAIEVAWNEMKGVHRMTAADKKRLDAEIDLLQKLRHKNVVQLFAHWTKTYSNGQDKRIFITELMTSGTLKQYLRETGTPIHEVLQNWCKQILSGLKYMHDKGIMHRDLKCDNIFIEGTTGEVKIGDLGLAVAFSDGPKCSVIGTPEFMAPEMYREEYSFPIDVWAFGMCVLEMITLEYPYSECKNPAQIYRKVSQGIKPAAFSNITGRNAAVRKDFVLQCIKLEASERSTVGHLLKHEFFKIVVDDSVRRVNKARTTINVAHITEDGIAEMVLRKHAEGEDKKRITFSMDVFHEAVDDMVSNMIAEGLIALPDKFAIANVLQVAVTTAQADAQRMKALEVQQQESENPDVPTAPALPIGGLLRRKSASRGDGGGPASTPSSADKDQASQSGGSAASGGEAAAAAEEVVVADDINMDDPASPEDQKQVVETLLHPGLLGLDEAAGGATVNAGTEAPGTPPVGLVPLPGSPARPDSAPATSTSELTSAASPARSAGVVASKSAAGSVATSPTRPNDATAALRSAASSRDAATDPLPKGDGGAGATAPSGGDVGAASPARRLSGNQNVPNGHGLGRADPNPPNELLTLDPDTLKEQLTFLVQSGQQAKVVDFALALARERREGTWSTTSSQVTAGDVPRPNLSSAAVIDWGKKVPQQRPGGESVSSAASIASGPTGGAAAAADASAGAAVPTPTPLAKTVTSTDNDSGLGTQTSPRDSAESMATYATAARPEASPRGSVPENGVGLALQVAGPLPGPGAAPQRIAQQPLPADPSPRQTPRPSEREHSDHVAASSGLQEALAKIANENLFADAGIRIAKSTGGKKPGTLNEKRGRQTPHDALNS